MPMNPAITLKQPLSLLEQANRHIYDFGLKDASDVLAQLNLRYGLGKIITALENRNIDTDNLIAVTTPDSGITRNKERWQAGFSYGCLIRWPSEEETDIALAFPQIKPNACGMIVAKIENVPDATDLCDKLSSLDKDGVRIQNSKLKLNVGVSNHFIEVCRVEESHGSQLNKGDIVAVIHTSPSELKSELYDFDAWRQKGGQWEETPLGPIFVLEGEVARQYYETYRQVEEFSFQKRLVLAQSLFEEFEVIANPTHQGLFNNNEARLGLYRFDDQEQLFPVTFRWDLHVYLMKPQANMAEDILHLRGKKIRSQVRDILTNLNMLPHGGGYQIPYQPDGWRIVQNGSKRLFAFKNDRNEFIFSSPAEIPYSYRGLEILDEIAKLRLGTVAAKLKQVYTLKY